MDLMTRMVEHHIWLTGEMVRLAGRLTDEQLDQPIELDVDEDRQTIRSLLSRLIGQLGMWNAAVAMRDYDWSVEEHESLSSMRERLAVEGPTFLAQVREVVEQDRLDDTFVDALCEPAEVFTYGGMIAHVLTFAAHRRTLVALAFAQARRRGARLGRPDGVGGDAGGGRSPPPARPARPADSGGRRPLGPQGADRLVQLAAAGAVDDRLDDLDAAVGAGQRVVELGHGVDPPVGGAGGLAERGEVDVVRGAEEPLVGVRVLRRRPARGSRRSSRRRRW